MNSNGRQKISENIPNTEPRTLLVSWQLMLVMEEQLGESFKVCLFCSQLTDEADRLSPELLQFLQTYLAVPPSRLPLRACSDCHRRSINARKFKEKCHRAFDKLEKNGITGGMVWGRSQQERREVGQILSSCLEWTGPSVGLEYDRDVHGPLMFPRITLTATDRALAEAHMEKSKSGRIIKRKYESLDENWDPDVDMVKSVKSEPAPAVSRAPSKPVKPQPQPESEAELSDCGEVFPSVGPYQCEICQNITNTKQEFVDHIKAKHRSMIDPAVLRTLESDLRKRKKKMLQKRGKFSAPKKKAKTKSKIVDSDSDEEFSIGTRKYKSSSKNIKYIDEDGNPLPKSAGKLPGTCNICGRTISRGNEIMKHQQSLSCRSKAIEKGENGENGDTTVVVVNMNSASNPTTTNVPSPSFKSEMTKRYEAEQDKDPGDYDEDYDEGQDEEVDEAIKAAVAASLETAREDLIQTKPEPEVEPEVEQPEQPEVAESNLLPHVVYQTIAQPPETFQPTGNLLWSNMWQ